MERHNNKYFTIWYGVYRKSKRQIVYAGGGHPAGLLWTGPDRAGAVLKQLASDGPVIGLGMGLPFDTATVDLGTYARLLVFSDGVYEIERPGGSMWVFDEFVAFLDQLPADASPLDRLLPHVRQMRGAETLNDDFSMVQVNF
jgi:sigma-B regulation protein RsbU (phosphoserine phosphatase)